MQRKRFHWARILRHKLVHVISLQQTNFNIPHWHADGLPGQALGGMQGSDDDALRTVGDSVSPTHPLTANLFHRR